MIKAKQKASIFTNRNLFWSNSLITRDIASSLNVRNTVLSIELKIKQMMTSISELSRS